MILLLAGKDWGKTCHLILSRPDALAEIFTITHDAGVGALRQEPKSRSSGTMSDVLQSTP